MPTAHNGTHKLNLYLQRFLPRVFPHAAATDDWSAWVVIAASSLGLALLGLSCAVLLLC